MFARLACLAALLLPAAALAQMTGEELKACVPNGAPPSQEYERENQTKEWPEEARRFKGDVPNVARRGDRLRLAIDGGKAVVAHRLTDPAWINWEFNDFGWLPGGRTLWYLSEESGFSHLYTVVPGERANRLTTGRWEVSAPQWSPWPTPWRAAAG